MVTVTEGTFDVEGKALFTKTWLPDGPPKAKLVIIHGFSDHINRYYSMFPTLAERGIAVYGFDQRGWGRSVAKPSEKGLTGPTRRVIADLAAVITPHLPADPTTDPPCFVMGHSMGGGEALTLAGDPAYATSVVARVRGWLLESPFIGFAPEEVPSRLLVFAGRLGARVLPHMQLRHPVKIENTSRDPAIVASIREDSLCHNTGTLEGLSSLLDRTAALTAGTVRLSANVRALWMGHGNADKITSFDLSRRYFDEYTTAVPDRQFRTYEGWYHQLHADGPETEVFYRDVGDWILARSDREGQGNTTEVASKL